MARVLPQVRKMENPVYLINALRPASEGTQARTEDAEMSEWWKDWRKPDGTPCTKMEVLRAFARHRMRSKRVAKFLPPPDKWLSP